MGERQRRRRWVFGDERGAQLLGQSAKTRAATWPQRVRDELERRARKSVWVGRNKSAAWFCCRRRARCLANRVNEQRPSARLVSAPAAGDSGQRWLLRNPRMQPNGAPPATRPTPRFALSLAPRLFFSNYNRIWIPTHSLSLRARSFRSGKEKKNIIYTPLFVSHAARRPNWGLCFQRNSPPQFSTRACVSTAKRERHFKDLCVKQVKEMTVV